MTIYKSVRKALDFIEANLYNDIGVGDVANAVSYSQFYFSREFSRYTHISVYDYILKRKLSESYKRLMLSDVRIIDLAFDYGFKSHETFTRAFKKLFGVNPSEAAGKEPLTLYEPIDDEYLAYLYELPVQEINLGVGDWFFEPEDVSELKDGSATLVILDKSSLLDRRCMLRGEHSPESGRSLVFHLRAMKHRIRVFHPNARLAFRYFTDNYYDTGVMGGNYILVLGSGEYVDVLTPEGRGTI